MFTSQNGGLHTGAFSFFSEFARIPIYRIEGFGGRMIFVDADALALGQRADASNQRPRQLEPALAAMPPMDEHPESCFVEPRFHSGALLLHQGRLSTAREEPSSDLLPLSAWEGLLLSGSPSRSGRG